MKFSTFKKLIIYKFSKHPKVMSKKSTILYIIKNKCSISRFGDGEINLILKKEMLFDKNNDVNQQRMIEAFACRNANLLVCLTSAINCKFINMEKKSYLYNLEYFTVNYSSFKKNIDFKYKYGDATLTRFYLSNKFKKERKISKYVSLVKEMWDQRNIIFIEGSDSKLGMGCDLFDNAKSIRRIVCPNKNCLDIADTIESEIIKFAKPDDLIVFALGPCATYLSYKLTIKKNLQCLDLGHIDIEYIWWTNKAKNKVSIEGKHAAEAHTSETIKIDIDYQKYFSQIVSKID